MNFGERNKRQLRAVFTPLFAFILVLSTVLPSIAFAEEGDQGGNGNPAGPELTIESDVTEQGVNQGGNLAQKIILTLSGDIKWTDLTGAKKAALIDAFTATSQPEEWEKVKSALKGDLSKVSVSDDDKKLTIEIPKVNKYYLTADQKISLKVPYQLLDDSKNLLEEKTFTIKATPKVLISGTATPNVSQEDIVKGGKTIVLTLVNAEWQDNITTNTINREKLLDSFTWGTEMDSNAIKAKIGAVKTSAKVVTLTLPALPGFKISNNKVVTFTPKAELINSETLNTDSVDAFTVTPVTNSTAAVSGTILSNTNEFDIAKGGKTITITLKNDIWASDIATNEAKRQQLINGFSQIVTGQKFDADVKRTSDTVVTLTLKEWSGFSLDDDKVVDLTISTELLTFSNQSIRVPSAFKISAVKAELSGTATPSLAVVDVQKGGKTIIVTLKNAVFKKNITFDETLIKTLFGGSWGSVAKVAASTPKSIQATGSRMTIKLPAVPDYKSDNGEIIYLNIPSQLIDGAPGAKTINAGNIKVGQAVKATLSRNAFTESDITGGTSFTITLDGAEWDPALPTNKSKVTTLLRGFTPQDQTKEWSMISSAIQSSSTSLTLASTNTLVIKVPAISNYTIVRKQEVNIVIPKTVLKDYKYDILVTGQLTINPNNVTADKKFSEALQEGLDQYIGNTSLENIRVTVPAKKVKTISANTVDIPSANGKSSITTIEVQANEGVNTVRLSVGGQDKAVTKAGAGGGAFTFVYTNLEKNSELAVSVFQDGVSNPLQATIYKKIGSGSKTYNELPKKDLTGSYSLYRLLTDKSLLKEILKYYSADDLTIGKGA
ncbi:hypothetical protein [Pseudobacillus wudalianchiensis]|uniref:Uncharacterized protein n=1 Tax=Pseudobacillus wudalianchiensis TaxID=1743143 RepID=A0A1B9AYK9_9BACI|nr:hypothetical protein [Bacillus wudalianchiensis]OCA88890.1 hypothetical protein A8F95_05525 [Bacillus wudalianchiensis]